MIPFLRRIYASTWHSILCGLLVTTSVTNADSLDLEALEQKIRNRFPDVSQLSVNMLHTQLAAHQYHPHKAGWLLIDSRPIEEFNDGHLTGAIRAESVAQVRQQLGKQFDPSSVPEKIVVYCSVGYRSSALAHELIHQGFKQVYNLEGSLFAWAIADYPITTDSGKIGKAHPYNRQWGRYLPRQLWSRDPGY